MRKVAIATILSLCFALAITFSASAHATPSPFTTSSSFTTSYILKSHSTLKSSSMRPLTATCTVTQSGRLNGHALTVTSRLSCSEAFYGTLSTQVQHCGLVVFGVCVYIDATVNIPGCNVSSNNPTCTGTGFLPYTGLWYVTTTGWAGVADGGTGSASTTAAINV